MSVSLDVLAALKPKFPPLHEVLNKPVKINVTQWKLLEERIGDSEVKFVLGAMHDRFSRSDIIGLRHATPSIRRRRIAIASLMWGYGMGGTRWKEWASNISGFLASPGLDAVLADCEEN
jgi:hypothetical protein